MALTSGPPGCQGVPSPMRHIEPLWDDQFSSKMQKGNVTDSYRCARAEEAARASPRQPDPGSGLKWKEGLCQGTRQSRCLS